VWNKKQWMLQRTWLMIVMLDACRRHLTPGIKATVNSIITGFVVTLEVMAPQLQLWHVVVNKLYKDHQNQLCGALGRGHACWKFKKPSVSVLSVDFDWQ
jgi:hypothetical protein